jgi:molybdopterin biosynthesis enzyme MoaB
VGEYENGHDKSKTESALAASCDAFEDETETWRRLIKVGGCEMVLTWGGFGVGDRDERHG